MGNSGRILISCIALAIDELTKQKGCEMEYGRMAINYMLTIL